MRHTRFISISALILSLGLACSGWAYTNGFTLNFANSGDTAGWTDPANTPAATIVAGETSPPDSPAYSPTPAAGAGYDSTPWMRIGQGGGDNFGVALAIYDGTAGGSTDDPVDYTVQADVFVTTHASLRYHLGIAGRWTAVNVNTPFEVFHSANTPGQTNGYGYRGGGVSASYGLFPAETTNRWVRMRIVFHSDKADIAIDTNIDGTYDHTLNDIQLTSSSATGKAGFFSVINDPNNGSAGVANQFSYFDNFVYTPASEVRDWTLY